MNIYQCKLYHMNNGAGINGFVHLITERFSGYTLVK